MQEIHGFSSIIEYIIKSKKPVIGHNCLSDIMRIYQCFVDELPKSYKQFKKVIHATFPEVYDTKHMAYCSRRQLEAHSSDSSDFAGNMSYIAQMAVFTNFHYHLRSTNFTKNKIKSPSYFS